MDVLHRFEWVRTLWDMEVAAEDGVARPALESDEGLWRRSLDGDGEAFAFLFDRHRDRVFGHAFRLVQTRHDAEDVAASVFLELWRRRAEVRLVDGSVLPWLLVTTTNVGRNSARGTRRYRAFWSGCRAPLITRTPPRRLWALTRSGSMVGCGRVCGRWGGSTRRLLRWRATGLKRPPRFSS
jgi:RNA polymerase sigma-70 factor (ECF subfamily)